MTKLIGVFVFVLITLFEVSCCLNHNILIPKKTSIFVFFPKIRIRQCEASKVLKYSLSPEMVDMIDWLETLIVKTNEEKYELIRTKAANLSLVALINGKENFYANWLNDIIVSF